MKIPKFFAKPPNAQPEIELGDTARDTITGFCGVVVADTRWLNGCRRLSVCATTLHDGKPLDSVVFDVEQLELVSKAGARRVEPTGGDRPDPQRAKDPQ